MREHRAWTPWPDRAQGARVGSVLYVMPGSDCPAGFHYCGLLKKALEKLGTPLEGAGETGDSPRKATRKLGTPQEGHGEARKSW